MKQPCLTILYLPLAFGLPKVNADYDWHISDELTLERRSHVMQGPEQYAQCTERGQLTF